MAPHRRAALWTIASNTGWASAGDRRIMLSTSLVAVCCSSASSRSRASRAFFALSPATDELLGRAAFDVTRLLRTPVLRRCAFAGSPPALERRRITAPRIRTRHLALAYHTWNGPGIVPAWAFQQLTNVAEPLDRCLKRGIDRR